MKGGGTQQLPFYSNTSGSQTGTMTGTTTPVAPEGWESAWNQMRPTGPGGLNPLQQQGVGAMTGALPGLEWAGNRFQEQNLNRTAPTLRNLEAIDPTAYATPGMSTAPTVEAQQIAARRGAEFMGDYQNPFQQQVIDASLAEFDQSAAEARTGLRAANAGAFGNKRFGVAEGQFAADTALGRAGLGANLRSQGFNTAASLGMQDAGRFLTADQSNQAASLQASQVNAANALAAQEAEAARQQQRNMFDASLGMDYNAQQDQLVRDYVNTQGAMAGIGGNILGAGTVGQGQNLDWLRAGLPLFGTSQTGTTTGTNTGVTSGYQTTPRQRSGLLGTLGTVATGLGGLGVRL